MASVKPTADQLDIVSIATEVAADASATAALAATFLELAGGTLTGVLVLDADPLVALGAATKQYVDNASFVAIGGDTMTGDLTVQGTIVGENDNASALRVRGASNVNDPSAGAPVQSYSGIFENDGYDTIGTLKTRFITGGNLEMDVVLISPHQLQLVAADAGQADGQMWLVSKTDFVFNARGEPEDPSGAQLILDRASTGSTGSGNTSNVQLSASVGEIEFASFPRLVPVAKSALSALGAGNATEPFGTMAMVTDDASGTAFTLAYVSAVSGGTWVRADDNSAVS